MYKNIIFDLYGTLVDISTTEEIYTLWRNLARFYSYNGAPYKANEIKKRYIAEVNNLLSECKYDYPDIDILTVFNELYLFKGISVNTQCLEHTAEFFRILSTRYIRLYDGAVQLIDELHKRGRGVYLLTNAQRSFTVPELRSLGILDSFDGIVISSDEGCAKPDRHFFNILLDRYSLSAEDCLMVGNDVNTDIKGALSCGMDCVYVHSNLSPKVDEINATYCIKDGNIKDVLKYI